MKKTYILLLTFFMFTMVCTAKADNKNSKKTPLLTCKGLASMVYHNNVNDGMSHQEALAISNAIYKDCESANPLNLND
ncbi:MAG: hypothetical protein ACI9XR_001420 [Flavobacterium sp.]|jgi:hypothetical protein